MINKRFTFPKKERLSWKRHIDQLFMEGRSFVTFPLQVIYLPVKKEMPVPVSVLVSVSKKRFKRAVKRNRVKRQIREAYRIHKHELADALIERKSHLLVAFLYLSNMLPPFSEVEKAMVKALHTLCDKE